jgi:hypothetical protein
MIEILSGLTVTIPNCLNSPTSGFDSSLSSSRTTNMALPPPGAFMLSGLMEVSYCLNFSVLMSLV